jgi:hypothetical protein
VCKVEADFLGRPVTEEVWTSFGREFVHTQPARVRLATDTVDDLQRGVRGRRDSLDRDPGGVTVNAIELDLSLNLYHCPQ